MKLLRVVRKYGRQLRKNRWRRRRLLSFLLPWV